MMEPETKNELVQLSGLLIISSIKRVFYYVPICTIKNGFKYIIILSSLRNYCTYKVLTSNHDWIFFRKVYRLNYNPNHAYFYPMT
jgi:hypothetical protein